MRILYKVVNELDPWLFLDYIIYLHGAKIGIKSGYDDTTLVI